MAPKRSCGSIQDSLPPFSLQYGEPDGAQYYDFQFIVLAGLDVIARGIIDATVKKYVGPDNEKRLYFEASDGFYEFIAKTAFFIPSGARETVIRAPALTI